MSEYRIFETTEFQNRVASLPREEAEYVQNRLNERVYPQLRRLGDDRGPAPEGANSTVSQGGGPDGRFRLFYRIDHEERIVYLLTFKRRELDEFEEEAIEPEPDPDPSSPASDSGPLPESSDESAPLDLPPFEPPEDFSPFAR